MTHKQMKSALQAELFALGHRHVISRVFNLSDEKTGIQLDRPFTKEVLEFFNNRFEYGISTHEYFTFSINSPNMIKQNLSLIVHSGAGTA